MKINPLPPMTQAQTAEFWVRASRGSASECWNWTGATTDQGYGRHSVKRQIVAAHRAAYEIMEGPVADGLVIDHLCRNRLCCNPAHLEPVTNKENVLRGDGVTARLARQEACKRGHPLEPGNLYRSAKGERTCRQCSSARRQKSRAKFSAIRSLAKGSGQGGGE